MELEEAPLAAPPPARGDEGAAAPVSGPDRPPHVRRDVPGVLRLATALAGPLGGGELLPLEVLDEQGERAIEDLGQIAAGNGVSEQVLGPPQLLARLRAGREADLVALGGEGAHDRPGYRRGREPAAGTGARARGSAGSRCRAGGHGERRVDRQRPAARARRDRAYGRRHVRLREEPGQKSLHLLLALAGRGREELLVVLGVRWRASMRAVVGLSVPAISMSRTAGYLRAARAASIRLKAASSESRRTSMQYLNVEEKPAPSKRRRASNSARWTMRATVASRSPRARRVTSVTSSALREMRSVRDLHDVLIPRRFSRASGWSDSASERSGPLRHSLAAAR